jgi:hypothetical protein
MWFQDMNEQDQQEYYERLASERAVAEGSHMQGRDQDQTEAQGEGADEAEGTQATGEGSTLTVLRCCRQRPVCAQLGRLPHEFGCRPPASFLRCSVALASRAVAVTVSLTLSHLRSQSPKSASRRQKRPR